MSTTAGSLHSARADTLAALSTTIGAGGGGTGVPGFTNNFGVGEAVIVGVDVGVVVAVLVGNAVGVSMEISGNTEVDVEVGAGVTVGVAVAQAVV